MYDQINVLPVWEEGILGTGVRVRVNDDGILVSHPEFAGKFDSDASCDVYLPDSFTLEENSHGTAVASILAANANNGECAVGIAPGVTLSACNMFLERSIDIELLGTKLHKFDISQNSWGPVPCQPLERRRLEMFDVCPFVYQGPDFDSPCDICDFPISSSSRSEDCELAIKNHCTNYYEHEPTVCLDFWDLFIQPCKYATLSVSAQEAFAKGIREGRDGKGIIYVFASGNEHGEGSNVNFDGIMSSRFTIVVGGTSKADGK